MADIPHYAAGLVRRSRKTLTKREAEYVYLVSIGLTNREIADRLVVAIATVEATLGKAKFVLRCRTGRQLAAEYVRQYEIKQP